MSADLIIILTAVLVAVPCAILGCFLVLRQMAMMGDAISHAVLPGIVIAFFVTGELSEGIGPLASLIGATVFGVLTTVLVQALSDTKRVKEDSSIGIVFTALFALGVFLVSKFAHDVHLDLQHVLYGEIAYAPLNPLLVGDYDLGPRSLWTMGIVTAAVVVLVSLLYKELKLTTFDPGLAAALGFAPAIAHYLLMGAVSFTTVGAFDSVGAILVVAFLIVPPATAYLLTERLSSMLLLASGAGIISATGGYALAYILNVTIAGSMAIVAGALFLLALLCSPTHGLLAHAARQQRNRRDFSRDLLLARLAGLGSRATSPELAAHLGWNQPRLARAVQDALRGGWLVEDRQGAIVLTERGRDAARQVATRLRPTTSEVAPQPGI